MKKQCLVVCYKGIFSVRVSVLGRNWVITHRRTEKNKKNLSKKLLFLLSDEKLTKLN